MFIWTSATNQNALLNAIKVKVIQNKKEITPLSAESNPYVPRVDELATLPANGERVRMNSNPTRSILPL